MLTLNKTQRTSRFSPLFHGPIGAFARSADLPWSETQRCIVPTSHTQLGHTHIHTHTHTHTHTHLEKFAPPTSGVVMLTPFFNILEVAVTSYFAECAQTWIRIWLILQTTLLLSTQPPTELLLKNTPHSPALWPEQPISSILLQELVRVPG